jgi:hypothetical protein
MLSHFVGGSRKQQDRRRATRTPVNATGELVPCPANSKTAALQVQVRDVSATGVGVLHSSPLPVGQKYVVRQESLPLDQPRLYTVVRSESTGDGQYITGMHASQLLDPRPGAHTPRQCAQHRNTAALAGMALLILLAVAAMFLL